MTVAMDRAARAVDRLEPIGLEELIARAGLLTRVDRKYAVTGADLEMVLELAPDGTRVLDIACERSFDYASTYLDTPTWTPSTAPPTGGGAASRCALAPTFPPERST